MQSDSIFIGTEKEIKRIHINCILYIMTDDYLSTFYLDNNQKFTCSKSLTKIINMLPDYFIQINRSSVVNLKQIESVIRSKRLIVLTNTTTIEVSYRRIKKLYDVLKLQNQTFKS